MASITFFFVFVPILSVILLAVNFILAPHKPNKEKKTPFECGYHSFLFQSRYPFTISFFIHGLLFLILDLEIVLTYPFSISMSVNEAYGLVTLILFASLITIGFVYELGIGALKFDTKENNTELLDVAHYENLPIKQSNILYTMDVFNPEMISTISSFSTILYDFLVNIYNNLGQMIGLADILDNISCCISADNIDALNSSPVNEFKGPGNIEILNPVTAPTPGFKGPGNVEILNPMPGSSGSVNVPVPGSASNPISVEDQPIDTTGSVDKPIIIEDDNKCISTSDPLKFNFVVIFTLGFSAFTDLTRSEVEQTQITQKLSNVSPGYLLIKLFKLFYKFIIVKVLPFIHKKIKQKLLDY